MAKKTKRGVKPGTKRGPYKKARKLKITAMAGSLKTGDTVSFQSNSVGTLPSLISDLTSTINTLEAQLTAQIDRIKSILN